MTPSREGAPAHTYTEVIEQKRLNDARELGVPWKKWGPYLSERQWGTVREDYSHDGNAWRLLLPRPIAFACVPLGRGWAGRNLGRSAATLFRAGALERPRPILKERLFGLTNSEGNHGEDVKEYYFYIDSTPTHSYMKYLYKYPQREYPYRDLVETNGRRSREEFEYELLDTGIFDDDRYFDVFVEYAKADPEDMLVQITVHNRGPEAAEIHLLPTLWFRNTWSWGDEQVKANLRLTGEGTVLASHPTLVDYTLQCDGNPELLVYGKRIERQPSVGTAESVAVCEGRISRVRHRATRKPSIPTNRALRPLLIMCCRFLREGAKSFVCV